jgi:hypothetical protein
MSCHKESELKKRKRRRERPLFHLGNEKYGRMVGLALYI